MITEDTIERITRLASSTESMFALLRYTKIHLLDTEPDKYQDLIKRIASLLNYIEPDE